jgi:hypothetical protein
VGEKIVANLIIVWHSGINCVVLDDRFMDFMDGGYLFVFSKAL